MRTKCLFVAVAGLLTISGQPASRASAEVELALEPEPAMKVAPCIGKPDLRVQSIAGSSPMTIGHNTNQLKVTVRNHGTVASGSFFVKVDLCPAIGPCTAPISFGGGVLNGTLAPNSSYAVKIDPGFYMAIKPGPYRLRVAVDSTNMVAECNEANNQALSKPLQFVPTCSQPDFFSHGTGPNPYLATVNKGSTMTVSVSVMNQGGPYSGSGATVKLFLRNVSTGVNTPIPTWQGTLNAMPTMGQQHFTKVPVQIPTTLPAGKYSWVSHADAGMAVAECEESNNWSSPNAPVITVN